MYDSKLMKEWAAEVRSFLFVWRFLMAKGKGGGTVGTVEALVTPVLEQLGMRLWDVRFEKEGASWYLRIFIDHPDGIDIEDCEAMTRPVNEILDQTDPISQAYVLEVGSAGLERELNRTWHFDASIGQLTENGSGLVSCMPGKRSRSPWKSKERCGRFRWRIWHL